MTQIRPINNEAKNSLTNEAKNPKKHRPQK